MSRDLFRFGPSLSGELDRRFDKRTIAAKMTDVPGHTRSIIFILATGQRFMGLIRQFECGRASRNQLNVFDLICYELHAQPDFRNPLRSIYHDYTVSSQR